MQFTSAAWATIRSAMLFWPAGVLAVVSRGGVGGAALSGLRPAARPAKLAPALAAVGGVRRRCPTGAGPQLLYYKDHLDILNQCFNQTGIFQTGWMQMHLNGGSNPVRVLLEQFLLTILAYVSISPSAWYLKGRPLLESTFAVLAAIGLGHSLLRVFDPRHWLLQSWFWA